MARRVRPTHPWLRRLHFSCVLCLSCCRVFCAQAQRRCCFPRPHCRPMAPSMDGVMCVFVPPAPRPPQMPSGPRRPQNTARNAGLGAPSATATPSSASCARLATSWLTSRAGRTARCRCATASRRSCAGNRTTWFCVAPGRAHLTAAALRRPSRAASVWRTNSAIPCSHARRAWTAALASFATSHPAAAVAFAPSCAMPPTQQMPRGSETTRRRPRRRLSQP